MVEDDYFADRETVTDDVRSELVRQRRLVSTETLALIVNRMIGDRSEPRHAIALVTQTRCLCVRCIARAVDGIEGPGT